jgi:Protein of unknown function (DUF3500)
MTPSVADKLAEKVGAFLNDLGADQVKKVRFGFPVDDERRDWAYFPRNHKGLPLHDLEAQQRKRAHDVLASCLSLPAYARLCTIMAIDDVLRQMEGGGVTSMRDSGRYFFSVFGEPAMHDPWGFRVEGHHVNLNFTLADGEVAGATPLFLGANPAEVRHQDYPVARPMGEEQDAGFELLASLDAGHLTRASLSPVAPPDFVLLNAPEIPERTLPGDVGTFPPVVQSLRSMPDVAREALAFDRSKPKGLPAKQMTDSQRDRLDRLVRVYIERLPDDVAAAEMARLDLDALHFAWAGSDKPGDGHYYRIQGGPLLIEYDNTQDGANHIHAVWRDAERDFGGDTLRSHLVQEHAAPTDG